MSLRQALEKLRSDIGKETNENRINDDNVNIELPEVDFDLSSEFFEDDECSWNTSTPLPSAASHHTNVSDASDNAKTQRIPLLQMYNNVSVTGDKSFDSPRCSLPVTSSSQKLTTFSFSRSCQRNVVDSDGLPPSKKPASEKEITRLNNSQHSSFSNSRHCSVPSSTNSVSHDPLTNTVTNSVSGAVMKSSTPTSSVNNKCNNKIPSLPVTPLSRHSAKRKFPGPAGLLPKLLPNQSLDDVKLSVPVSPSFTPRSKVTTLVDLLPGSQGDSSCDFSGAVWKSALEDLSSFSSKDTGEGCCISELVKGSELRRDQKGLLLEKVSFLVAVLKSVVPQGNGACITLKDPTGEIPATLHLKVLEEYQTELIPGTIILLNKVSLFSPSQRKRYLNITINNVLKLYLQNGNVIINEQVKVGNPTSTDNTPHCTPEDNIIPQDNNNLTDSVELFNTDVDQEWCGFLDTIDDTSVTTTATVSTPSVCAVSSTKNSTGITNVTTNTTSHIVSCTTYHDSFSITNRQNNTAVEHMTTGSVSPFTDGLEDEDLDSLLRDFEEDHLCT